MPLIAVASPKGGVGKTTLAANLAVGLQRLGRQVTAVDFDSQNALRFLLLPDAAAPLGVARCVRTGRSWREALRTGDSGVRVVPYGDASAAERLELKETLLDEPLADALSDLLETDDDILIADTAPGEGRLQARLEGLADVNLIVLLADAGSMALVPGFRDGLLLQSAQPGTPETLAILNQVDPRRRLSRDISEFIAQHHGGRFVGSVHYDEALAESAAHGKTAVEFAPESLAARDINEIAAQLDARLRSPPRET